MRHQPRQLTGEMFGRQFGLSPGCGLVPAACILLVREFGQPIDQGSGRLKIAALFDLFQDGTDFHSRFRCRHGISQQFFDLLLVPRPLQFCDHPFQVQLTLVGGYRCLSQLRGDLDDMVQLIPSQWNQVFVSGIIFLRIPWHWLSGWCFCGIDLHPRASIRQGVQVQLVHFRIGVRSL